MLIVAAMLNRLGIVVVVAVAVVFMMLMTVECVWQQMQKDVSKQTTYVNGSDIRVLIALQFSSLPTAKLTSVFNVVGLMSGGTK